MPRQHIRLDERRQRLYAVCGTRLYSIAAMSGGFPAIGDHQPGEMGGVWTPPLKLLDGYWVGIRQPGQAVHWLTSAAAWQIAPEGVTLSYTLSELGLAVERLEWVIPDEPVLVVDLTLSRLEPALQQHSLTCDVGLLARSDLHGAWLAEERLGWRDGDDLATYDPDLAAVLLRDTLHSWEVCVGATMPPQEWASGNDIWGPERTSGRGTGAALWYRCCLTPGQPLRLRFLIAGAASDTESARSVFARVLRPATSASTHAALDTAHERARQVFLQPFTQCVLETPDAAFNEVFAWAKLYGVLLMLEVPGTGRAAQAGLPEFPWWFGCDLAYGILPMLPAGQGAEAAASLRTLASKSQGSGRVPHEIVSHGLLFHPGNLIEIPLFARALYHTYRWTGDRALLEELFPFCLQGIEQEMLSRCLEAGEQAPQGSSLVETPEMAAGLQVLDVAAYLVEALELLGKLAEDLAQADKAAQLRERASALRQHLRQEWWLANERLFGDLRASRAELETLLGRLTALPAPDDSARTSIKLLRRVLEEQHQNAAPQTRLPWLLSHMVQALAVDAGLPSPEQAEMLLGRLETPEWMEPYGIVLNAATNRKVMTLPTGALAVGEARYGHVAQALATMKRMATAFGAAMPGMLSEYAPDAGCFMQLWSNYGVIWPVVQYFFGLHPDVSRKRLVCVPQLPPAWPSARLHNIPVGSSQVDIELVATAQGICVRLETTAPEWEVSLGVVLPVGASVTSAALNGKLIVFRAADLDETEGRQTWLAPASVGRASYELIVSWSPITQLAPV
ncbi:MAG TPA: hypothetical protein VH540_09625 [Ktedonobacterales bacterium]